MGSERELTLKEVKGLEPGKRTAFLLQFVTNPDDTELEFVPGIGFISYRYHHHGTVADTEMSLAEFHSSAVTPSNVGAHSCRSTPPKPQSERCAPCRWPGKPPRCVLLSKPPERSACNRAAGSNH